MKKIPQFEVTVEKANRSSLPPPIPPRIFAIKERARGGKGGAGTPRDLCHIGEKLNNCPRLRLVNLPTFGLGVLFPRPRNDISGPISCSKNSANSSNATAKSPSEYTRENIEHGKKHCRISLNASLRDGNAIKTLLMTAQINTVNHLVPSTTEPSTSLVRVGTDACESIKCPPDGVV
ncbi:hypothetical protein TNCV_457991 [Trichonephila clavipes]|nr:hypothetical protein TNCV_457991 [Trichonephila clavipes]